MPRPRRRLLIAARIGLLAWTAAALAAPSQAQTPSPSAPPPPSAVATASAPPTTTPAPTPPRPVARYGYEVVATYPHDPTAFTQGLVIDGDVLTESTGRHPSTVRRVRLSDGEVLTRRDLALQHFGEGLTILGDRAFSLTWTDGKGFIWNADDLTPLGEFAYSGQGWGLTHDGTRLILSDGQPRLRFLDPDTFAETGAIPVTIGGRPLGRLNELEFIDGEVWANIWQTDFIVRIDPKDGQVVGVIDLSGLLPDPVADPADDVLNGIAWDPETRRLFVTGKNWPKLFEIRLVPQ